MSSEHSSGPTENEEPRRTPGLKRIMFFTSSEYGQANVILAVAYELLLRRKYDIHIVSFEPLKNRIRELNKMTSSEDPDPARFHAVPIISPMEAVRRQGNIGPYPAGVRGALKTYRTTLPAIATAWDGSEYMAGYEWCLERIHSINPNIIVIDPLFSIGLEACKTAIRNYVVLSPNTFQDILRKQQPFFRQLCRYPAVSSGFPYPVPWSLVPANIYLKISIVFVLLTSPKMKELMRFRKSQNLPALPPVFNTWQMENHYLVPSIPETDFPCQIKDNVYPCGPILLPVPSVAEADAELEAWLGRNPTVLINLGSHIRMDNEMIKEFAVALKVLLDRHQDIQILWKLKTSGGLSLPSTKNEDKRQNDSAIKPKKESYTDTFDPTSLDAVSTEIQASRVNITEWMSVDPLAVLQSGHIICSVHHGGSNSFHEALSVGIPQIILPCWLDTFEFANRVEYLGIGVYGSRTAAPRVDAWEFSRALMRVLGEGEEGEDMRRRAKELATLCGGYGGRKRAAERVVEILEGL
ncbi:UDP-Glycosyltransferase/glycogen phosphorylase [Glarea lozoyensis ATCC 20868]|uniref:UDP-Glycosyltransferase/glycogen phosphorylase n=1 Tax=Glarea lozoyensis (strain ATCC 20868 / MF5171) TaxID=1116229 RepID=S3CHS6_GLAL2|nr:UDP-Glycosyltransferase/glycogen phosphorylase [Glarea lozoyensis ATCC 20868]EPE25405.1 UDP-Glycosyltransferase/glycogen phosphorylase [Glarea lozoyensis ATCC 20868]